MITAEQILERRNALMADYNAIAGAIQDCDYWLEQLDEGESSDSPESPTAPEMVQDMGIEEDE